MAPLRNILPIHKREAPAASGEPKNGNHPHTDRSKNPMNAWVTNRWRNEIVAALAEFAGTFMFLCKSAWSIHIPSLGRNMLMNRDNSLRVRRHSSRKYSCHLQRPRHFGPAEQWAYAGAEHKCAAVYQSDLWLQLDGVRMGLLPR